MFIQIYIHVSTFKYTCTCICMYIYIPTYKCIYVSTFWYVGRPFVNKSVNTGWGRPIGCLKLQKVFLAKEPLIIGLFCGSASTTHGTENVHVYMHLCVYVYSHIHKSLLMYMYIYIGKCMQAIHNCSSEHLLIMGPQMYVCLHTEMCVYIHIYIKSLFAYIYKHRRIHIYIYMNINIYTYVDHS